MAEIKILTSVNFASETAGQDPVLVDFWAEWCGPCRLVAPVLEAIAKEFDGQITIAKLNIDEHQQTAIDHGVMSIPTMIVFQNGEEQKRIVGARNMAAMVKELSDWIS